MKTTVEVQFRNRTFHAQAEPIGGPRRHVYKLAIPTRTAALISYLPGCVRLWLGRRGFLPTVVVLKERNPERPDEHLCELANYRRLESLQGGCIPWLYGEAKVHHGSTTVSALLLEFVDGQRLDRLPPGDLTSDQPRQAPKEGPRDILTSNCINPKLVAAIKHVYDQMEEMGMAHGDPQPHNFLATVKGNGYKVTALDFEFSGPPDDPQTKAMELRSVFHGISDIIDPEQDL